MLIEVRPVEKEEQPWAPVGKESFKAPVVIEASVKDGRYQVALKQEELDKLEEETGYDLSLNYNPESAHPFWSSKTAQVRLENRTMFFDQTKPVDRIRVGVMKKSPLVAPSLKAYEKGLYPEAEFVITNEEESLEGKALKIKNIREANILAADLSPAKLKQIVSIITGRSTTNISETALSVAVHEIIEEQADRFLLTASLEPEDLQVQSMVKEAIFAGHITRRNTGLYFDGDLVGATESDVVTLMSEPQNQPIKMRLLDKLNNL